MLRRIFNSMVVAVIMLSPMSLFAGGPPLLCLPVDGVTSGNAQQCIDLVKSKLGKQIHLDIADGVRLVEGKKQWYMTFYMASDVKLSDVNAALDDSAFSVPQDRLRLFGHAIVELDASEGISKALTSDLGSLPFVSIEKSEPSKNGIQVTLDMPYPVHPGSRRDVNIDGWETFQRNDFSSDRSSRSEGTSTLKTLPLLKDIRELAAKRDAKLKDVRWSINYACREVGAVAEPAKTKSAQVSSVKK